MIDKMRAIIELRPNAKFTMVDDTVTWLDSEQKEPTESEIKAKITELEKTEPMNILRSVRNQKLAETDWTQSRDVTLSNDTDWKTYRQALRDITKTYKTLDTKEQVLDTVKWPTEPTS